MEAKFAVRLQTWRWQRLSDIGYELPLLMVSYGVREFIERSFELSSWTGYVEPGKPDPLVSKCLTACYRPLRLSSKNFCQSIRLQSQLPEIQPQWQARNAVVGGLGRRHGIRTPLNDTPTALLAVIDAP